MKTLWVIKLEHLRSGDYLAEILRGDGAEEHRVAGRGTTPSAAYARAECQLQHAPGFLATSRIVQEGRRATP